MYFGFQFIFLQHKRTVKIFMDVLPKVATRAYIHTQHGRTFTHNADVLSGVVQKYFKMKCGCNSREYPVLPPLYVLQMLPLEKIIFNVSKNSTKKCECSQDICLQSLKILGPNAKAALRNKKDKSSMNSGH